MIDLKALRAALRKGATRSRIGQNAPRAIPIFEGQGNPEPIPPDSLEDFLERWTHWARDRFMRDGVIKPFALAVSQSGETRWLSCGELRSKAEADAFEEAIDEAFAEANAVRGVIIAEVRLGNLEAPLPSPGEGRQDALVVTAIDAESEVATASLIEEDWELGAPTLRPAERLTPQLPRLTPHISPSPTLP